MFLRLLSAILLLLGFCEARGNAIPAHPKKNTGPRTIVKKPYFYVHQGKPKCFYENTPENLPVSVSYAGYDNPGMTCTVSIKDPHKMEVANRIVKAGSTTTAAEGKMTYLTRSAGQHSICVSCGGSKWFGGDAMKWSLNVDLGDTEIDLNSAVKGTTFKSQEQLIQGLQNRVTRLFKEHIYRMKLEGDLQTVTRGLGSRVVMCGVLEVGVLTASTVISVMYLQRYFRQQKLV